MGVNTERVAQAWTGRSAVDIISGSGSPSVSFHSGGPGTYGFNNGSQIFLQPSVPAGLKQAVLIHELGHALSLHHTMNTGSIMHPLQAGPTWPSALDYGSLVRAWGAPGEGVKTYEGGGDGGFWSFLVDKAKEFITDKVHELAGAAREKFLPNQWVTAPIGIAEKATVSLVDKAAEFFGGSSSGSGDGAGGVEQWRGVATQALRMTGDYSPANLDALLRRMNQESGGNPRATNGWDVNALRGDPSKGLMQVIGSTFRANAAPGYDRDIYDPLSNILASIRYTKRAYGSVTAGWGRAGGYKTGGLVTSAPSYAVPFLSALGATGAIPTLYDNGGWLRNTGRAQLIEHKRRDPDAVLTSKQWADISQLAATGARTVTNNTGGVHIEGDLVAADPAEAISMLDRRERRKAVLSLG